MAASPVSSTSYFALSLAPRYSVLFALPLLIVYEALAALLAGDDGGIRNGADVLLRSMFTAVIGRDGSLLFIAVVILVGIWYVARDLKKSRGSLRPSIFCAMLAESVVVALAFGIVVGTLTAKLLGSVHLLAIGQIEQSGWATRLMLSLGAGLYEELLFRVLLVSALAAGARVLLGVQGRLAGVLATVVGAIVFSAFHYIGPYGEPFQFQSFTFRMISGVAFSALYLLRGFGITAWTHALYDVFLLL